MFEKVKVLRESAVKLYPYFFPSYNNSIRTLGFLISVIGIPLANFFIPPLFLKKDSGADDKPTDIDINTAFANAFVLSVLTATQHALSTMLTTSTIFAIKEDHAKRLMDDSNFLLHGSNKDITSLQYATVGVGARGFAGSAVPTFTSLPGYTISSVANFVNICTGTKSYKTSGTVLGLAFGYFFISYFTSKKFFDYQVDNQKIENDLVAKVGFIEAHRNTIPLMGASEHESESIARSLQKINDSVPKLSFFDFAQTLVATLGVVIASQFLGGYYKDEYIRDLNDNNAKVLNVTIMTLLSNIQNIAWVLSGDYCFIKLNLEQLQAFDRAYKESLNIRNNNNKVVQKFEGDFLSLQNFKVYKPNTQSCEDAAPIVLFDNITLELATNKIYKLSGHSGSGKTTFLKAITNNWQYTDGLVVFPENTKDRISFIPQYPIISVGTLLEILTYPLTPEKFVILHDSKKLIVDKQSLHFVQEGVEGVNCESYCYSDILEPLLWQQKSSKTQNYSNINSLISSITNLLIDFRLMPCVINENELLQKDISWNERFSGG